MANPFLVLGGIAVGIITAAFGVLQVPGWVGAAQDAAAQNDISNATIAQSASNSELGHAVKSLDDLKNGAGVAFESSGGVTLDTDANGSQFGVIAVSQSGRAFGRVNGGKVHSGATRDALLNNPGFACEWVGAGLKDIGIDPAVCATTSDVQERYVVHPMASEGYYYITAQTGTNLGFVSLYEWDGEIYLTEAYINGVAYSEGSWWSASDMSSVTALLSTDFADKWEAAGFGPLDLSEGLDGWDDAAAYPVPTSQPVLNNHANGNTWYQKTETMAHQADTGAYRFVNTNGSHRTVVHAWDEVSDGNIRSWASVGTEADGFKFFFADTLRQLLDNPDYIAALNAAGLNGWWEPCSADATPQDLMTCLGG